MRKNFEKALSLLDEVNGFGDGFEDQNEAEEKEAEAVSIILSERI